jgi:hypothetical protein
MGELSRMRRSRLPSMTKSVAPVTTFDVLHRTQFAVPFNDGMACSLASTGRMGTNPPHVAQVIAHHFSVGVTMGRNAPSFD